MGLVGVFLVLVGLFCFWLVSWFWFGLFFSEKDVFAWDGLELCITGSIPVLT